MGAAAFLATFFAGAAFFAGLAAFLAGAFLAAGFFESFLIAFLVTFATTTLSLAKNTSSYAVVEAWWMLISTRPSGVVIPYLDGVPVAASDSGMNSPVFSSTNLIGMNF